MNLKFPLATAMVALALQGCAKKEKTISGDYKLLGDFNNKVPLLLQRDGDCDIKLMEGTLAFHEDKFDSKYRIVRQCPAKPDSIMPDPGVSGGSFEQRGDTLAFYNESKRPTGIAIRNADTLKITGPQHTLLYLKK